jgi:uncharacterized protein
MKVLLFIKDQILSMNWLDVLIQNTLSAMGLSEKAMDIVGFFIYDTIKIMILLISLVFIISFIQSHFSPKKSKDIISKFSGISGNIVGAILGILTPFCSCSSIPIFIGFISAGLPLGVTFSFLITSPMVDLAAVALLVTEIESLPYAILYAFFGVLIGVIGGWLIGKMKIDNQIKHLADIESLWGEEEYTFVERIKFSFKAALSVLKQTWWAILIGVGIGAAVHGFVPTSFITNISDNIFAPIIATLAGIPMYSSTFGTIPVAAELYFKGMNIGTVLSFMMAVTALSVPSMIMISRVIKKKLLAIFIIIVTIGIILSGYAFNLIATFI